MSVQNQPIPLKLQVVLLLRSVIGMQANMQKTSKAIQKQCEKHGVIQLSNNEGDIIQSFVKSSELDIRMGSVFTVQQLAAHTWRARRTDLDQGNSGEQHATTVFVWLGVPRQRPQNRNRPGKTTLDYGTRVYFFFRNGPVFVDEVMVRLLIFNTSSVNLVYASVCLRNFAEMLRFSVFSFIPTRYNPCPSPVVSQQAVTF